MKFNKWIILPAAIAVFATTGCDKLKDLQSLQGGWQSEIDNAAGSSIFDDIYKQFDNEAQEGLRDPLCPTVTFNFTSLDSTIGTMDLVFGTNCLGSDGRYRSGEIHVAFNGRYRQAGATYTITTSNYVVDGYAVTGTLTIVNNGLNGNGNINYTHTITNATITDPDGLQFTWESVKNVEWIEGELTDYVTDGVTGVTDDVYLVTGTAEGVNRANQHWTANITDPVRYEVGCRWHLTDGRIECGPDGYATRSIDYGDGTCDGTAVASVGSYSFTINIP